MLTTTQRFQPAIGRLLVKPISTSSESDQGIILPETLNETFIKGDVIKANKQVRINESVFPMQVQQDEIIYFIKNDRQKISLDGETFYLIHEDEVVGVLN